MRSRYNPFSAFEKHYHKLANSPKYLPGGNPRVYELKMSKDLETVYETKKF